jgi:hypothetical protein
MEVEVELRPGGRSTRHYYEGEQHGRFAQFLQAFIDWSSFWLESENFLGLSKNFVWAI